jgi:hypothetical protein
VFRATIGIALVTPLLISACVRAISTVPVRGSEPAVAQLAGRWEGEYSSEETGRGGSITFQLRAGADTAEGEVVMTARGNARSTPDGLTIRFVVVHGDEVSGVLAPYPDPDCGCTLTTTFRGVILADVIEGTFETTGVGFHHPTQRGRWRVVRR